MPRARGGRGGGVRGGRGVMKNLNELCPRSGRDYSETAEGSGAGGRRGRRRSPTPERAPPSGGGGRVGRRRSLKASRPLIHVLVINDNHYGLTFLFEL
jgi:hypothetical protein